MRLRRLFGALLVVGSLGGVLLLRRRGAAARQRIDLYLADGSKVTLAPGTPEFDRLAPLAQDALRATAS